MYYIHSLRISVPIKSNYGYLRWNPAMLFLTVSNRHFVGEVWIRLHRHSLQQPAGSSAGCGSWDYSRQWGTWQNGDQLGELNLYSWVSWICSYTFSWLFIVNTKDMRRYCWWRYSHEIFIKREKPGKPSVPWSSLGWYLVTAVYQLYLISTGDTNQQECQSCLQGADHYVSGDQYH